MQPQDSKIKLYIISGLGANARVFDKITFNEDIEPVLSIGLCRREMKILIIIFPE